MTKTLFIFSLILIISCSLSLTHDNYESKQNSESTQISKDNVFDKILLVVNKEIKFEEIAITYDELINQFSDDFREKFVKDGGDVFNKLLTKWRTESIERIEQTCPSNDATIISRKINLDKSDTELNAYTGELIINCEDKNSNLKFSAFETNGNLYVIKIK